MASQTITVPDPTANNSTGIEFHFTVSIDGSGNITLSANGFIVNYSPPTVAGAGFSTQVQDAAHLADLTGAQLVAIRAALLPVLTIAKTRMGF